MCVEGQIVFVLWEENCKQTPGERKLPSAPQTTCSSFPKSSTGDAIMSGTISAQIIIIVVQSLSCV